MNDYRINRLAGGFDTIRDHPLLALFLFILIFLIVLLSGWKNKPFK